MKTRLIKTALVAAVAGITLIGTAGAALAEDPPITTFDAAEGTVDTSPGIKVNGSYNNKDRSLETSIIEFTLKGSTTPQKVYCIDIRTSIKDGVTYEESTWDSHNVGNLPKIQWILHNAFPRVTADELLTKAGVDIASIPAAEKEKIVYGAVQATIWSLSDGFALKAGNSTNGDAAQDAAVSKIYEWLNANAQPMEEPSGDIAFEGPNTGNVGERIGPFTINSEITEINLSLEGKGKIVDKDGNEITGPVKGGDEFYVVIDEPGKIKITGKGTVQVPAGRLFVAKGDPNHSQKLILAEKLTKTGEASIEVEVKVGPTESPTPSPSDTPTSSPTVPPTTTTTPGGGLPVTGSSLTIIGVTGAALLAGGAALVLFMRRRRAAASTWGSDEDGLA